MSGFKPGQKPLPRRLSLGWQDDAACRGFPLALFFGSENERGEAKAARERRAAAVCGRCPVRAECLQFAVSGPEKYGTWGGLNEDERASERRRWLRRKSNEEKAEVA